MTTDQRLLKALKLCAAWIEDSVGPCPVIDDDWEDGHSELAEAQMAINEAESKATNNERVTR